MLEWQNHCSNFYRDGMGKLWKAGTLNQNKWDLLYNNFGCCHECRIGKQDCLGALTCQPNTMPGAAKGAGLCIGEGEFGRDQTFFGEGYRFQTSPSSPPCTTSPCHSPSSSSHAQSMSTYCVLSDLSQCSPDTSSAECPVPRTHLRKVRSIDSIPMANNFSTLRSGEKRDADAGARCGLADATVGLACQGRAMGGRRFFGTGTGWPILYKDRHRFPEKIF